MKVAGCVSRRDFLESVEQDGADGYHESSRTAAKGLNINHYVECRELFAHSKPLLPDSSTKTVHAVGFDVQADEKFLRVRKKSQVLLHNCLEQEALRCCCRLEKTSLP
jgi:hypothetical protein